MVDAAPSASRRLLRHSRVRRSHTSGASPGRAPVVGVVTQPDRARGRGQKSQPGPVKQFADEHALPLLQPMRLRDEVLSRDAAGLPCRSRSRRGVREDPDGRRSANPPARAHQRARLTAAEVPRRRADSPRRHVGRRRDGRHHHARRQGARCRPDDRKGDAPDRRGRNKCGRRA